MADQDFPSDFDINDSDSDTNTSTSSTASENYITFEPVQPVVLELHEIRKDSSTPPPPEPAARRSVVDGAPVEVRTKKLKKKKRLGHTDPHVALSASNSRNQSRSETTEDEFFDAQGSLHILPENKDTKPDIAPPALQMVLLSPPEQSLQPLPPNSTLAMRASTQAHPPAVPPPTITTLPTIPTSQSESTVPTAPVAQPPLAPAQSDHGPAKGSHTTTSQPPSSVERPTVITKTVKRPV